MGRNDIYRRGIVLAVATVFILTSLSSVYAGTVFNDLKCLDDEVTETAISTIEKITDRELLLDKYDLAKMPFKYLNDRIRKPTIIDGEDGYWDIIVPDDYPTIQEAVDNAEIGYQIFVRTGTYKENIIIEIDGIILYGEDKYDTNIDGSSNSDVIQVNANYLNISGFTIRNSRTDYAGIKIHRASGNLIEDNILTDNSIGVAVINHSHANNITGNEIFNNNIHGISLSDICTGNVVYDNSISSNGEYGIAIDNVSRGNIITWNDINNNRIGVNCSGVSDGNTFHHNSLFDNDLNAYDSSYDYWDNGIAGNYWSDYTGVDSDGDGIGDEPYNIPGGNNSDNYPLMSLSLYDCSLKQNLSIKECFQNDDEKDQKQSTVSFDGDTIVVPDDYSTIQEAIDNAVDGDTIIVLPGIYNESVVINKQLSIIGDNAEKTIVNCKGKIYGESLLDQYQIDYYYVGWGCYDGSMFAQSFMPSLDSLTKVELLLWKKGNPNGLNISIRKELLGPDLTSVFISADSISEYTGWVEFDFQDINVTPNETYYIIWSPDSFDKKNTFYWGIEKNNPYENGCGWLYDGLRWKIHEPSEYPGLDFCFKTYCHGHPKKHVFCVTADNVEISNFTIANCDVGFSGVRVYGNNCNICNNILRNCGGGVELWKTSDTVVDSNTMIKNVWGIYIHFSENCNILNNSIEDNYYGIELGVSPINISGNIIENNSLNGILCLWSFNCFIDNNLISFNDDMGIQMFSSDNNSVKDNIIKKNQHDGISIHKSINNTFTDNIITENLESGVSFWYRSKNNQINKNKIKSNGEYGVCFYNWCNSNSIANSTINSNNDSGIYFDGSYNTIIGNNISSNLINGIVLGECDYNHIINNTINGHIELLNFSIGIFFLSSQNSIISNNVIKSNTCGIALFLDNNNNKITGNTIDSNKFCGIGTMGIIFPSLFNFTNNNNTISKNTITNNGFIGIGIAYSPYNIISENTIKNHLTGISLFFSSYNIISENTITNHIKEGITLDYSSYNNVNYNNFIKNLRQATFCNAFSNNWSNNYWSNWKLSSPKPILGRIKFSISIPWIAFDYNPAKEPFEIPEP